MTSDTGFDDKRRMLAEHWMFASLPPDALDRLVRHVRIQPHRANEVIFRKDDPGLGMMAVLSGRVRIVSTAPDEKEVTLNIINAGEVFGEIALLDGKPRTADAVAMEPTRLLVLDRRDFMPFLERHPEVAMRMIQVLCERIRNTTEQLEDTTFLLQSGHLAKTLLRLAERYGAEEGRGVSIRLRMSQRELGTLVGMRREAMNRQLSQWREAGILVLEDGYITLLDPDALERFVDELL